MELNSKSLEKLATCHTDLQKLAIEAIINAPYEFIIINGYRTPDEQFELFKQGRTLKSGKWVKTGNIVTYLDGFIKKSKHNEWPSLAFDIGIILNGELVLDVPLYLDMALHILKFADKLFDEDIINNRITWGGHWIIFKDFPHYQI